jgi:hypothetical protein
MSGLAMSQGTTGLIERVLADGISNAGIYVAGGSHHVVVKDCETRNAWNAPDVHAAPAGIGISDAHHILVLDHRSHHNLGSGLLIATNGMPPVRLPGLPEDAYGAYYPAPQEHGPATLVEVVGGSFSDNAEGGGAGITIGSGYLEAPKAIRLVDVAVERNRGPGILIEAGYDIAIGGARIKDNGVQGVLVRDVVLDGQAPEDARTASVQIVDASIFDNGRRVLVDVAGLDVHGRAEEVALLGGAIGRADDTSRQRVGVGFYPEAGRACRGFFAEGMTLDAAPMPFGWGAEDGRVEPLDVPEGQLFDCKQ